MACVSRPAFVFVLFVEVRVSLVAVSVVLVSVVLVSVVRVSVFLVPVPEVRDEFPVFDAVVFCDVREEFPDEEFWRVLVRGVTKRRGVVAERWRRGGRVMSGASIITPAPPIRSWACASPVMLLIIKNRTTVRLKGRRNLYLFIFN